VRRAISACLCSDQLTLKRNVGSHKKADTPGEEPNFFLPFVNRILTLRFTATSLILPPPLSPTSSTWRLIPYIFWAQGFILSFFRCLALFFLCPSKWRNLNFCNFYKLRSLRNLLIFLEIAALPMDVRGNYAFY